MSEYGIENAFTWWDVTLDFNVRVNECSYCFFFCVTLAWVLGWPSGPPNPLFEDNWWNSDLPNQTPIICLGQNIRPYILGRITTWAFICFHLLSYLEKWNFHLNNFSSSCSKFQKLYWIIKKYTDHIFSHFIIPRLKQFIEYADSVFVAKTFHGIFINASSSPKHDGGMIVSANRIQPRQWWPEW